MTKKSRSYLRTLLWLAAALFVIFLLLQFVRPTLANPPVTADFQAPPEVKQILADSCYNCHSNQTKLAWFDQIVPAYWIVVHDVNKARRHVNFSEIGRQPAAQQKATLFEAVNMVQFGAMPLPSYKLAHPDAAVTPGQLAVLRAYLNPPTSSSPAPEADVAAAASQYAQWIAGESTQVSPAPNGIAFPADYRNWHVINITDRFDNQTIRAVLGNDIAVKAVAENRTNPWPDGTTFAKVAWTQQTGAFFQVEFMIKDSKKYAATLGWGFARWRGLDRKPYGKDAAFVNECVGCHTPLRKSDYVFTIPLQPPMEPFNPLQWKVITLAVNKQDSTLSTLFGNDVAVDYARQHSQHDYPAGSSFALVTWTEREDPHWFGARIPDTLKSIELISLRLDAARHPVISYQNFDGIPLKKTSDQEVPKPTGRVAYILAQPAAVMP